MDRQLTFDVVECMAWKEMGSLSRLPRHQHCPSLACCTQLLLATYHRGGTSLPPNWKLGLAGQTNTVPANSSHMHPMYYALCTYIQITTHAMWYTKNQWLSPTLYHSPCLVRILNVMVEDRMQFKRIIMIFIAYSCFSSCHTQCSGCQDLNTVL